MEKLPLLAELSGRLSKMTAEDLLKMFSGLYYRFVSLNHRSDEKLTDSSLKRVCLFVTVYV